MQDLYLSVWELLFEGYEKCSVGYSKDHLQKGEPYVVIRSDDSAYCGRGLNTIYYKGKEIASELMRRPTWGVDLTSPSIGLYHDAERWLLNHLPEII